MSLSVSCECGKTYKVADTAAGKKIRCKECGAAIPVPKSRRVPKAQKGDEESDFLSMDLGDYDHEAVADTPAPQSKRRPAGAAAKGSAADLNVVQRFLLYALRNPWVGMALFFFWVWVPLSFVFTGPMFIVDLVVMGLCFIGFAVGLLLALIGVTIRNPLAVLSIFTVGIVAALVIPAEYIPAAGRLSSELLKQGPKGGTVNPPGNFDAGVGGNEIGVGGSMALYCGILGVVMLAHITLLLGLDVREGHQPVLVPGRFMQRR
jgi:hypothetical protein